ncbi:hypothetical protein SUGI_0524270 [Cryptomeria japonica]|uniref:tuliposide A-converting enzyme 1, chloroplastic n=1 Tax=Cryptomeria japonica TaxID=3369 RepID=UPI002408EB18|nr:tuliposide A-converting enzyme 1, chloroplastic [Cryptomeria japonica]GLJ26837.1 hypothetical protein SUGI_0524270 [Cryptomeria japonica]
MGSEARVDFFPLFRILKDGSVQRCMGTETVPPESGGVPVASQDITLDATKGVYVRLYIPTGAEGEKLPVVVYTHGGGFSIESAASPTYHNYLNLLAKEAKVICVSVDYRRVPEHRLPIPYDDCFSVLEWLDSDTLHPSIATKADLGRCFIAGDSAGGNIVHRLGFMATEKSWRRLCIEGAVLIHPFFDGEDKIHELGPELQAMVEFGDGLWKLSLPDGADKDHPFSNPIGPRSPPLSSLVYRRLLVVVAGKDMLKYRGKLYYEALKKAGKEAELIIAEEEEHVFHLKDLQCPNAVLMMKCISDFIASTPAIPS